MEFAPYLILGRLSGRTNPSLIYVNAIVSGEGNPLKKQVNSRRLLADN